MIYMPEILAEKEFKESLKTVLEKITKDSNGYLPI
jgi:hypothetical protein